MFAKVVVLGLFCVIQNVTSHRDEGDPCQTPEGLAGVCKFPIDCPGSVESIKNRENLKICGFVGKRATICCAQNFSLNLDDIFTMTPEPTTVTTETSKKKKTPEGAIARKKCNTYTTYAFPQGYGIDGGTFIAVEEFGHMAHIGYGPAKKINWSCGGSIISEYFILTAAHCLKSSSFGNASFVRGGVVNQKYNYQEQFREIESSTPYPKYSNKYHDIAIIKVKEQFNFNAWVRPACIFPVSDFTSIQLLVTGWGKTENGQYSKELLKVPLEIYPVGICNETYQSNIKTSLRSGILEEYMICAGSSTHVRDTCEGDSGGPLQYQWNTNKELIFMYNIVGVTAFGKACGAAKDIPGVYTRVSAYIEWIESVVWPSEVN